MNIWEVLAFALYLLAMIGIGLAAFFKSRGGGEKEFFLGGRKMNPWVVALSAQASDMSAWLLMGLPGSILAFGMGKVWIAIGLFIGTVLNWQFTAPRLRRFSQRTGDAITIPQYLRNRFMSKSNSLQIVSALVFFVCYAIYAASSFKACGSLFATVLNIDPNMAMLLGAAIIVIYTFLGGFEAVCWTDFVQGMLMLIALMIVPIIAWQTIQTGAAAEAAKALVLPENYWNLNTGFSDIASGLAWGLGYFGMPHILVRFMSIDKEEHMSKSKIIAIVWVTLALGAAVAMALVGRLYLPELANSESSMVFVYSVRGLFPGFIAGLLLSAILAASMSTADSQLLVSASAFTSDVYKPVFRKNASDSEMMWIGRIVVVAISVAAYFIAVNPESGDIMNLVENAWAGFGSSFGPVILLSLYWRKFTYKGAVAGIIAGALTDVLWLIFLSGPTGIYELLPGFIVGLLASVIVSKNDKTPISPEVDKLFDSVS